MTETRTGASSGGRAATADGDWLSGRRLDWLVTGCVCWGTAGLVLDVRSHVEGFSFAEEGFLTPEHAVIYSGFLGVAFLLAVVVQRARWRGAGWRAAVPPGYGLGLAGLALFAVSGPADALWHATFGAEADVEALASPTHLGLATGGTLFLTSPLRATLHRARDGGSPRGWRALGPLVVTAILTTVVVAVFTVYAHPAFLVAGAGEVGAPHALSGLLLEAAVLAGAVLFLTTRVRLPPGAVAMLVALPAVAVAYLGANQWLAPWYVGAGVLAEAVVTAALTWLGPRRARLATGAAVPAAFAATGFGALLARDALAWSVHLWAGAVFMAAVAGTLLAVLADPPVTDGSAACSG